MPGFSFCQTASNQGHNSISVWNNGTVDGQQYHQDQGYTQNGFDAFSSLQVNHNVLQSASGSHWNDSAAHTIASKQMSRLPSQESTGTHTKRTSHASCYNQSRSSRPFATVSQATHISSRADVTGRSSPVDSGFYNPTHQFEPQALDSFSFSGPEDISGAEIRFQGESLNGVSHSSVSLITGSSSSMFDITNDAFTSLSDGSNNLASHIPISQDSVIFNPNVFNSNSPTRWNDNIILESQGSSPTLLADWALPPPQMVPSATNSPLGYSTSLEGLSPRVIRKPMGPRQSKVVSDLASRQQHQHGTSDLSDESLKMVGRSSVEIDNTARDHPLYQNVTPKADGLYHCPWEGQDGCQHKPEKLKCNYDKSVDSHLKPYRCKVIACENSRFSSTACLLRHEREAHAMHGHGDKPYLCTYEGCDRGAAGNGFPRHWNLRDHMKRVHDDPGTSTKSNASGSPPPINFQTRGKKRKAEPNDGTVVEKASKRNTTPPAVAVHPQEPSLTERYLQSEQKLLEIVKQLNDPRNASNMTLLRSASDCIKVMAQTTQRINAAPVLTFAKQQVG